MLNTPGESLGRSVSFGFSPRTIMDEKAYEKAYETVNNGQKSVRVFLINPPSGDNPWRTKQEYLDDRRATAEAGERQREAHRALMRQVRTQSCQMWIAFFAVLIAAGALFVQSLKLRQDLSQRTLATTNAPSAALPQK